MAMAVGPHLGPCTSDRAAGTALSTTAIEPAARSYYDKKVLKSSFAMGDAMHSGRGNRTLFFSFLHALFVYVRCDSAAGSIDASKEACLCNGKAQNQ